MAGQLSECRRPDGRRSGQELGRRRAQDQLPSAISNSSPKRAATRSGSGTETATTWRSRSIPRDRKTTHTAYDPLGRVTAWVAHFPPPSNAFMMNIFAQRSLRAQRFELLHEFQILCGLCGLCAKHEIGTPLSTVVSPSCLVVERGPAAGSGTPPYPLRHACGGRRLSCPETAGALVYAHAQHERRADSVKSVAWVFIRQHRITPWPRRRLPRSRPGRWRGSARCFRRASRRRPRPSR